MSATPERRTLWRFASVGVINTLAGLAFIYLARARGFSEISANVIGYAAGLLLSFTLNRRWTFVHRGPWLSRAVRFAVVVVAAWAANLAVLILLLKGGVNAVLAQAAAVAPYAALSYLGCRWWVFAPAFTAPKQGRT